MKPIQLGISDAYASGLWAAAIWGGFFLIILGFSSMFSDLLSFKVILAVSGFVILFFFPFALAVLTIVSLLYFKVSEKMSVSNRKKIGWVLLPVMSGGIGYYSSVIFFNETAITFAATNAAIAAGLMQGVTNTAALNYRMRKSIDADGKGRMLFVPGWANFADPKK